MGVPVTSNVTCATEAASHDLDLGLNWDGSDSFDCFSTALNNNEGCTIGPDKGDAYALARSALVSVEDFFITCEYEPDYTETMGPFIAVESESYHFLLPVQADTYVTCMLNAFRCYDHHQTPKQQQKNIEELSKNILLVPSTIQTYVLASII